MFSKAGLGNQTMFLKLFIVILGTSFQAHLQKISWLDVLMGNI